MATVPPEALLAEVEDILRTLPAMELLRGGTEDSFAWLGRAFSAVNAWSAAHGLAVNGAIKRIQDFNDYAADQGYRELLRTLHAARSDLRLSTIGPLSVAVGQGSVFDYFDEVRRVVEAARSDLLFVDPYLDAEFVSRYLPHIAHGVSVRLLASARLSTLVPAVQAFAAQSGLAIEVRSAQGIHDRYVFVDKSNCYQSGASFKDGAKKAPTTLTQITDAFVAVQQTYEGFWSSATKVA